ncbi:kinase-like domain-containing protein [Blyttiomyces helicus]|uniref:Kinase-like domain-containing protein n=1 Tax=Blyttiomyces helicus TaxID=388810 RepID=A0A4P9WJY5_9FUNG|nr:kinase-like domain-containing protein [Blyttiomyces helicus]|eukprot:RKO93261.1 kinase-like domain-containing protein [Blyttiomyces helicus]
MTAEGIRPDFHADDGNCGPYRYLRLLGYGSFGRVHLAEHTITGAQIAIKVIQKMKLTSASDRANIELECKISQILSHPHIVEIYDVFETEEQIFICMEKVDGGELHDLVLRSPAKRFTESDARPIFREILSAVQYLHKNSVVHRDLKMQNIMLDNDGHAKLIDFGIAGFFDRTELLQVYAGTVKCSAPEILMGKPYVGPAVDMWSLGVLLYGMVLGQLPFEHEKEAMVYDRIINARFSFPSKVSLGFRRLLQGLLVVDPKKRFTLKEVLDSP